MKVVITGGAGFIGGNLCRALGAHPAVDEVVALDDLSSGARENLDGVAGVELVVGSILDEDLLDRVLDGADAVVHLAARGSVPRSVAEPVATHQVNTEGTLRVLEAARRAGGPHVIFASSSSVYGANPTLPKHESLTPMPASPYAASKLAGESYVLAWANVYDLPALAFRFFNVFGPLQPAGHAYAAVVPVFVDAALSGRPLPVHGDGQQTRDFTFVDTVTEVITIAVIERVTSPTPVNLAFGGRISLLEAIGCLEKVLEHPLEVEHQPVRPGDVRASQADNGRLRELFAGVEPVDFVDGLAATVDWYRRRSDTP